MRTILIGILFLHVLLLAGQNDKIERITIEEGLSQGMIHDILQDQEGFLWIGTKDGLNRYDGYEFKVYNHIPFNSFSISGHEVTALHEDEAGRLWVGTFSNGLNLFDPASEKFWHITQNDEGGLSSNTIRDIAQDDEGNIWVATAAGPDRIRIPEGFALSRLSSSAADITTVFDISSFTPTESDINPFSIWTVVPVKNRIYLGGDNRFFEINLNQGTQATERTDDLFGKNYYDFFLLQDMIRYGENQVVVSLNDQIALISPDTILRYPLPIETTDKYPALYTDDKGYLWGGARTFFKFDPNSKNPKPTFEYPLGKEPLGGITTLLADRSNIFWMGTRGYGLIKYNPVARIFNHLFSGPNSSIRQIYIDQENNYWIWSYSYEIKCVDPTTGEAYLPEGWPEVLKEGRWVLQAQDGEYWFHFPFKESETELVAYDPKHNTIRRFPYHCLTNPLSPMAEGPKGNIWLSGGSGQLIMLDKQTEKYQYFDMGDALGEQFDETQVVNMHLDKNGVFWLGTLHGLVRFNPATNEWKAYRHDSDNSSSISENHVLSIHAGKKEPDILWIGTKGGGLNRFDKKQESFKAYNTEDGLPNNVIYGILEEQKGHLWLSTNRGLARFEPTTATSTNYSSFDGLQSNEFNTFAYAQAKDGTLAFGGINGLNIFHPDSLESIASNHQVVFTEVKVNNKKILEKDYLPVEGVLRLSYDQNLLYFKFSATDFTAPSRNTYRYQMEGVDEQPLYVGNQREVAYANLAPGAYNFKVWGANNTGSWSEARAIRFIITPPWWKTSVAYAAYLIVFAALAYLFHRFQVNRIRLQKQLEFEHMEAERLAEMDRMKTNFFSNVTHEFRTPLTLILEPARQLYKKIQHQQQKETLGMIVANGQHLLKLVNQLLDLSKIEGGFMKLKLSEGDLVASVKELYHSFIPIAERKGIELSFSSTHANFETAFDEDKLEQCLNNLLSNALKFTSSGGAVDLRLDILTEKPGPEAVLTVTDNGQGISKENLSRIFDRFFQSEHQEPTVQRGTGIGLSLVKEFAKLMRGDIQVESEEGKGSTFILSLPLAKIPQQEEPQPLVFQDTPKPAASGPPSSTGTASKEEALVLVVEDNSDLRSFISAALQDHFRVITAVDGAEGWQKAQSYVPDLVVSDLMMPRMNGMELLQQVKEQQATAHIPVVMLTAKSSIENKISGFRAGADAYLSKPFHTEELLVRIEQLIDQRRKLQALYSQQKGISKKESGFFNSIDNEFLQKLTTTIDEHLEDEALTVEELAKKVNLSRSQLHRKLKALTDQSATEFLRNYRLDRAMELLRNKSGNIGTVAMMVGFPNQQYFSTRFKKRFGLSPSEVR